MKMKKGFTLIELMVVIVIMGILAAVAVPKIFGNVEKAKLSGVGETLSQFEQAVTNFYILNTAIPNGADAIDFDYGGSAEIVPTETVNGTTASLSLAITGGECDGLTVSTSVAISGSELQATRGGTAFAGGNETCASKLTKVSDGTVNLLE